MAAYVAIVIGCLECTASSEVVGIFDDQEDAKEALVEHAGHPLHFVPNPYSPYDEPKTCVVGDRESDRSYEVHRTWRMEGWFD